MEIQTRNGRTLLKVPGDELARADLAGRNLSGAQLAGIDLTGANLSAAQLVGAILDDANLANVAWQGHSGVKARADSDAGE